MRMAYWVKHPPSRTQLYIAAAVIVLAAAIMSIEWLGYWPEWMKVERLPRQTKLG
ncbi:phage tail protein (plasmid) [Rhizobium sp. 32-5/1]|uniref:phage tail protein n=1 Tax=Rhizobium sp. 32-5/1 TaxID=3019602 RepID=UPI00240E04F5|nr:phage tail protein [Rhizobium sp. 32-5/1]WEZ85756.1 phage tail protein [Rhizobium sp. 32-5/1]